MIHEQVLDSYSGANQEESPNTDQVCPPLAGESGKVEGNALP